MHSSKLKHVILSNAVLITCLVVLVLTFIFLFICASLNAVNHSDSFTSTNLYYLCTLDRCMFFYSLSLYYISYYKIILLPSFVTSLSMNKTQFTEANYYKNELVENKSTKKKINAK